MVNPILSWEEDDVWEFLHHYGCEANPLYQCDQKRIGCIGCPMQNKKGMRKDFQRYPKYYYNYVRAFDRLVKVLTETGRAPRWQNGEEVMRWWVSDVNEIQGQALFDGFDILDV
jgi:phosphoadenosine phosphosulfate reductase